MLHDQSEFEDIIQKHPQEKRSLIPILQDFQAKYNYLPPVALNMTSQALEVPLIDIISVASFYNAFSLEPRGKHIITICLGTACHVKGAERITETFEGELGIKRGGTTQDMMFSLEAVRCIGCCGLAPVLKVGEEIHGQMAKNMVPDLLHTYESASG